MGYTRTQILCPRFRRTLQNVKYCAQQLSLIEDNSYWVIPGVQQALNKRYPFCLRLIWTFVLIMSFSLCAYQISARFMYYFEYPVAVNIHLVKALKFPSFTICSQDTVGMVKLANTYLKDGTNSLVDCLNLLFLLLTKVKGMSVDRLWEYSDSKTLLKLSVLEMGSHHNKRVVVNPITTYTPMGTCATFHVDANLNGSERENQFILKFSKAPGSCEFSMISGSIQEPGQKLSNLRNLFSVSPLVILHAYLAYKQYEFLNTPLKHCVDQDTYDECEHQCFMQSYKSQNFKCRFPFMPPELGSPFCVTANDTRELYSVTADIYLRTDPIRTCKCPPRCHKTVFDPALNLVAIHQNDTTFIISFRDTHAIAIRERFAYDFISLMCDVGGNLGLYFGLSILSIWDFIKTTIYCFIGRKRLQRRQYRRVVKIASLIYYAELAKKKTTKRKMSTWFIVVYFTCFCFAVFQIVNRINYQHTQPTRVIVRVEENGTVSFPLLTMCAPSYDYLPYSKNLSRSKKIIHYCEATDMLQFYDIPLQPDKVWKVKNIKDSLQDIQAMAKEAFGMEPLRADGLDSVDTPFGNCIQYRIGSHEYTGTSSIFMFLTFAQAKLCGWRSDIYITPPGQTLSPSTQRKLIISGKNAVMYTVKQVIRMNTPRQRCMKTQDTYNCRAECLKKKIENNIKCRLPFMHELEQPPCTSFETARKTLDEYIKLFYEVCEPCIQPCREDIYETRIYVEPFDNQLQTFYTNFFVYSTIDYIEEIPVYGYVQMFCDIGSIMGLVLGLCVANMFVTVQDFLRSILNHLR